MIHHVTGNLLEADAEAFVNTVNTVGVMGKGIALQIRQAFPQVFEEYQRAVKRGEVQPGRMHVVRTDAVTNPRFIINFPTKQHWRGSARVEFIRDGLVDLVRVLRELRIESVAVPPLGCGSGGLRWSQVRPLIENALGDLEDIKVLLYAPAGAPAGDNMIVATKRPNVTPARAAFLRLFEDYAIPGYRLTMLEVEKLAYFLQAAGEPLKLRFDRGRYGPYAEQMHHVLQRLEGHYIRGYGDRSRGASIYLMPGSAAVAVQVLEGHPETRRRIERVARLIRDFETPYGMELLATVHWVASEDGRVHTDPEAAVELVQGWSEHKRRSFRADHIEAAWQRLIEEGWIGSRSQPGRSPLNEERTLR
jgi:O-acetyl-ADP-ribose deacetylase (regulator of RNase III)